MTKNLDEWGKESALEFFWETTRQPREWLIEDKEISIDRLKELLLEARELGRKDILDRMPHVHEYCKDEHRCNLYDAELNHFMHWVRSKLLGKDLRDERRQK